MARYTMLPRFWFRKPKSLRGDIIPPATVGVIYMRLELGKLRADVSTELKITYADWDANAQKVKGKSEQARQLTLQLQEKSMEAVHHYLELCRTKQVATPERVKQLLRGEGAILDETLLAAWDAWGRQQQLRYRAGEIGTDSAEIPTQRRRHVVAWLKFIRRPDLLTRELTAELARGFYRYLLTEVATIKSADYAAKTTRLFGQVCNHAIERKVLFVHPLIRLQLPKTTRKPIKYLPTEEVSRLAAHTFTVPGLNKTRDAFLFMCYTGLAWADARAFHPAQHLKTDAQGQQWLHRPRTKTNIEAVIPLLPEAAQLLNKYKAEGRIPVPSNQKMNERLREMSALISLSVQLTSHVGRRTFAMLALDAGVSIESVSAMLGHASIKMTQQAYAKVKERRIGREMRDAGLL